MIAIIDGDVLLYMSIWGKETQDEAFERFQELFEEALDTVFADDYVMAIGGPDNYRVDLFPDYKGNRTKAKKERASWFFDFKEQIVDYYDWCYQTEGCEADDMIRTWANELEAAGKDHIVITVDKDLDCITGLHMNPRLGNIYTIDAEYANRFYWKQMLMGDQVDNIPGLPRVGTKTADKLLEGSEDYKATVCKEYAKAYGEEGYSYLLANGRLIHIWNHVNDHFKVTREYYDKAIS